MASKKSIVGAGVGIYCRVSTQEQNDEGISLSTQENRCMGRIGETAHLVNPEIEVYIDNGLSGGLGYYKEGMKKSKFRPELTRLLQDINAGKIKYLFVYRNDRLFRNLKLWGEILDDFIIPNNVEYISVCEPLDPLTSQGRMTSQIIAAVAEQQRRWTGENIRDALRYKREQGFRAGSPPYGWKWSESRQDGHRLVERDEREGLVVIDICEKILSGWNSSRVGAYLESNGVKSPSGGKKWWADVVKRIALEPFNAGLVRQEDGQVIEGKHSALRYFDPEFHEQVVAQVKKLGHVAPMTRWSKTHLLLPKLLCANCGHRLYVDKREDYKHRVYWCKQKSVVNNRACVGARAKIAWADAAVIEVIRSLARDERLIAEAGAVIESDLAENFGTLRQEKAKLERDLREDRERLADALELLTTRDIENIAYKALEDRVIARREDRTARLQEIDKLLADTESNKRRIQEVKEILRDFDLTWDSLTIDEQRKTIDLLIEELQLSQTHLIIKPYFANRIEVRIPAGRFRQGKPGDAGGLSQRELSVLKLLGDGLSRAQIAERLGLALQTIYTAVSGVYSWLGVDNIAEAVAAARPILEAQGDELPTDGRMAEATNRASDEPTPLQLETLRAVVQHSTQAEAYSALEIPYNNGSQRLRLLQNKVGAKNLEELFKIAAERGWIDSVPDRQKDKGLVFTPCEAEMMRAVIAEGSVAAAGRLLGLSRSAANSRVHTVVQKLGVHRVDEALSKLHDLDLDPANLGAESG